MEPLQMGNGGFGAPAGTQDERTWAAISHIGPIAGYFIGFGHILLPLLIMIIKGPESEYVRENAREALNFQISITIYAVVAAILILALIGVPLLVAIAVFDLVCMLIAASKASQGETYRYPLCLRLVN